MKNNIFVIGSNSFSGSNFVDFLLDKKLFVVGISRSKENKNIFLKYKKKIKISKILNFIEQT